MSRTSPRQQRLHLFKRGNDRCPICLASFTERDVEQGTAVTLEHVPPKSFKVDSIAMCLTCFDCNNSASRVEHAAYEARREPKVRIKIGRLSIQTGIVSVDARGRINIRMSKLRVPPDAINGELGSRRPIDMTFTPPNAHYATVPWLKAAYLSVFSLLGVHGYRYAEGEAIEPVRRQIMNPRDEVIPRFALKASDAWRERDGIAINRLQTPCWAVKMGDCIVLLPRSWDQSLYEWIGSSPSGNVKVTVGGGPLWYPGKFGDRRVESIVVQAGYHPKEVLGEDLFGLPGRGTQGDKVIPFVFVDYSGQEVTIIITDDLGEN